MDANRALAPALMFEFTQSAYRAFGPLEHESLAALAERGFRFSMDHVTDLRMEPRELADRGFRFLKVPATLLLNQAASAQSDIHAADLADLLARSGIDLIAERIESESMVVDLLDYDVRFGQGFLFSPPRPVRAEALQARRATDKPATAGATSRRQRCQRAATANRAAPRMAGVRACLIGMTACRLAALDPAFFRACAPTTTCCCATSGAWCTTASSPFPQACDALMRARAQRRHASSSSPMRRARARR